jgi:hypothetical protein
LITLEGVYIVGEDNEQGNEAKREFYSTRKEKLNKKKGSKRKSDVGVVYSYFVVEELQKNKKSSCHIAGNQR